MRAIPTSVTTAVVSASNVSARVTAQTSKTGVTIYATATAAGNIAEFVDDVTANARL
jgi:hypothetical protein